MTDTDDITTEKDVALDTVAALDAFDGLFGSGSTHVKYVGPTRRDNVIRVELDNGDVYELVARQVS